jgi:hypothetical protein
MAMSPEKFRSMNRRMPGIEQVDLLDDAGQIVASEISAERRPITRKSVFSTVQIQSDTLEWVLHDDGVQDMIPRDGMIIRATDGQYTIQDQGVLTQLLGTRHHCLTTKQRGVV